MATATSIFGCTRRTHGTHVSPHSGVCSSSSSSKQINNKELALPSCARYSTPIIMLTESGTHAMLRAGEHTVDEDWVYGTEMAAAAYAIYLRRVLHVRLLNNNIGALRSRSACIRRFNNVCSDGRVWNGGREAMDSTKKGRKSAATCSLILLLSISSFVFLFTWCTLFCADWKWNRKFSGLLNAVVRSRCIEIDRHAGRIESEYRVHVVLLSRWWCQNEPMQIPVYSIASYSTNILATLQLLYRRSNFMRWANNCFVPSFVGVCWFRTNGNFMKSNFFERANQCEYAQIRVPLDVENLAGSPFVKDKRRFEEYYRFQFMKLRKSRFHKSIGCVFFFSSVQ